MYAARGEAAAAAFRQNESLAHMQERPLGERAFGLAEPSARGSVRCVPGVLPPGHFILKTTSPVFRLRSYICPVGGALGQGRWQVRVGVSLGLSYKSHLTNSMLCATASGGKGGVTAGALNDCSHLYFT